MEKISLSRISWILIAGGVLGMLNNESSAMITYCAALWIVGVTIQYVIGIQWLIRKLFIN